MGGGGGDDGDEIDAEQTIVVFVAEGWCLVVDFSLNGMNS